MTATDVLKFLFERWKVTHQGGTQDEYADHVNTSRATMNLFLNGRRIPPLSTMKRILLTEGYKAEDFKIELDVQLPDAQAARNTYEDLFNNLQTIVTMGGDNRILGIRINLEEFARGARTQTVAKKPRRNAAKGNLLRSVKKKTSG